MVLCMLLALPVRAECVHEYVQMRQEPTCEDSGVEWLECRLCGRTIEYKTLAPLGHTFGAWYVAEEPGCVRDGVQARDCTICGFQETAPLPPSGHAYLAEVKHPTCTAGGYTRYTCRACSSYYIVDYTNPLGHWYDNGVLIKEPTETALGRVRFTCVRCSESYLMTYPFRDIDSNAYYFTPVIWAVNNGITSGYDETHFMPHALCDRSQVVTFLWRAAGKPEADPENNPFRDVPQGSFYEQAVLWAYQSGITNGVNPTAFSPYEACSRAQVVTFLHRLHGCPEPTASTGFPDVAQASYYRKAVQWAAEQGITVGSDGGYFYPDSSCTRAEIVTFLHRDAKNP